jgi:hypothetical protein
MATMFESLEITRETDNAARRTLGAKLEEYPTVADFASYSASDIKLALANALTDGDFAFVPPGAVTIDTNYTIASGKTVYIMPGATLTVASGKTLTLAGTIVNLGTLTVTGTLTPSGSGKVIRGSLITHGTGSIPAALTEGGTVIGGTNDGDLPDLASPDDTKLTAAVRELATKINALRTALLG